MSPHIKTLCLPLYRRLLLRSHILSNQNVKKCYIWLSPWTLRIGLLKLLYRWKSLKDMRCSLDVGGVGNQNNVLSVSRDKKNTVLGELYRQRIRQENCKVHNWAIHPLGLSRRHCARLEAGSWKVWSSTAFISDTMTRIRVTSGSSPSKTEVFIEYSHVNWWTCYLIGTRSVCRGTSFHIIQYQIFYTDKYVSLCSWEHWAVVRGRG